MFLSFITPIYNCEQYIKQNFDIILCSDLVSRLKAAVEAEDYHDQISFGYISQFLDGDHSPTDVQKTYVCSGLNSFRCIVMALTYGTFYKRASIDTRRFINGVRHIEDFCFNIQNILNFSKVVVLPDVGCYYNRKNVNSISKGRQLQDRIKANDDSFIVYNALYNDMLAETDQQKKDFLWRQLNFSISAHLYTMMMQFDDMGTVKRYIGEYRKMGFYPLSPTGNRKADLFARFANHKLLLLFVIACRSCYKRLMSV